MPTVGPGACPALKRDTLSPLVALCILRLPPDVCCMYVLSSGGRTVGFTGEDDRGPSPTKRGLCTTLRRVLLCVNFFFMCVNVIVSLLGDHSFFFSILNFGGVSCLLHWLCGWKRWSLRFPWKSESAHLRAVVSPII